MDGRNASNSSSSTNKPLVSVRHIQDKQPSRFHYLRSTANWMRQSVSQALNNVSNAVWSNLSLDQLDLQSFKDAIRPVVFSGAAFAVGEWLTSGHDKSATENNENEVFYKFMLGAGILAFSAAHRITEKKIESSNVAAMAAATELVGITYLFTSTFHGSRNLLEWLPESVSLVTSIGASVLAAPTMVATAVEHYQDTAVKRLRHKGAQISNTAAIGSGLTSVGNFYFQAYHFLKPELLTKSRLFQLALISENVLKGNDIIKQVRNVPALLFDVVPPVLKRFAVEKHKIAKDFKYNTAEHKILQFKNDEPLFSYKKRKDLRSGDLVAWDEKFDIDSSPISGEVIAYECNDKGKIIHRLKSIHIEANYKSKNGEDKWREFETKSELNNEFKQVYLHAIQKGKQVGVLKGTRLNFFDAKNAFIRVKEEEFTSTGSYEKKAVINQIITEYKDQNAMLAPLHAMLQASIVERHDWSNIPPSALTLLFNLSTMMVPFAETFLRDMVNINLMKEINKFLADTPMETIDALRAVDFYNVLSGYYKDRFPSGVAIVSDKTGTLTTPKMDVLGFWEKDRDGDVQADLLMERKGEYYVPEDMDKQRACFEVFASAYQNNKKEREQEEFSILEFFKKISGHEDCLSVEMIAKDHFKKKILFGEDKHVIETMHLGLHRALGGRLTLVADGDNKYLVFFGVPNAGTFRDMPLLNAYSKMKVRKGVLSRDWGIARAKIPESLFTDLKTLFAASDERGIENLLLANPDILHAFEHYGTFIIDNPVKKEAEKFISHCAQVNIPVFIATGDTVIAAENIAKVLCPENTRQIIVFRPTEEEKERPQYSRDSTVIFSEIYDEKNDKIKDKVEQLFNELLLLPPEARPAIIFAGMKEAEKGLLARHLKARGFFVVANGDASNDKDMMRHADFVMAHVSDDGKVDPEVEQFVNLTDMQLQKLLQKEESFYQLFDIHMKRSLFAEPFIRLANSQEKPSVALVLKSAKMSFELARTMGFTDVKDMPMQHFSSMLFDWGFMAISFNRILAYSDVPIDNVHLARSMLPKLMMLETIAFAAVTAALRYTTSGQATNWDTIAFWLACLPIVENILFSSFKPVQEEMIAERKLIEPPEEKSKSATSLRGFFGCRNRRSELPKTEGVLAVKKAM